MNVMWTGIGKWKPKTKITKQTKITICRKFQKFIILSKKRIQFLLNFVHLRFILENKKLRVFQM